jgi:hypothetical protein
MKNLEMFIGKYVFVRTKDAGLHAGYLHSHEGRECVLTNSRRIWYWRPADSSMFLSGVVNHGLHPESKVSEEVSMILLTENCEISLCTPKAEKSIREIKAHVKT